MRKARVPAGGATDARTLDAFTAEVASLLTTRGLSGRELVAGPCNQKLIARRWKRGDAPCSAADRIARELTEGNPFRKARACRHRARGRRDPKRRKTMARAHSAKFERCVKDVKRKGGAKNPWAVCHAALERRAFTRRDPAGKSHRYRFGQTTVTVKDDGEAAPPWSKQGERVFRYKVTVNAYGVKWTTPAYDSIHNYQKGVREREFIAAMVVDELASAYADPDEMYNMVLEGRTGREAYEAGKDVEKLINTAQRMGQMILQAAEIAREKGLL